MDQLANTIRDHLDTLAGEYIRRLGEIPDYARLGDEALAGIAQDDLRLIATSLEEGDRTIYVEFTQSKLSERLDTGFSPESFYRALAALEETLLPSVNSVEAAKFLWRTLSEARNVSFDRALQESHQLLQLVMDNIPQSVFWKDRNLVYLGCNREFALDAGFSSAEEIVGKTDFEMPWLEQAELYRADDFQVMESDTPKLGYEEPQTTPEGGRIWLRTSKVPMHDAEGNVVAILGMYEDITERKEVEEALREQQAFLHQVIDLNPSLIFVKDRESRFVLGNKALADIYGTTVEDLVGKSDADFTADAEQAERFHLDDLQVMDSLQERIIPDRPLTDAEGNLRWVQAIKRPLVDEDGVARRILGVSTDITERKRAEEALRRLSRENEEALRIARMGHWEFDIATQTFIFNDQYYALHGTTAEEAGGYQMTAQEFAQKYVHPDDAHIVGMTIQQALETTDPDFELQIEARIPRADGELRWITVWFRVDKDQEGRTVKLYGVNQDITERKRLEQQIQESLARRGRQVQTSTEVAQEIAAATALDELYQRVVRLIKERFGYYHAQIFRYEPAVDAVVLVTAYGQVGEALLKAGHRLEMGRGVVGTAAATGQPVLASDVSQVVGWVANPYLPDSQGELAVPILLRDEVLGILDVQSDTAGALTLDDQMLLEGLCGQIAIAIESTRLRQEMEESLAELERLYRVATREGWEDLRQQVGRAGYRFDQMDVHPADDYWRPEIGQAVKQGVLVSSQSAEQPAVAAPLSVRGEVFGALGIEDSAEQPLSRDELALLEAVTEQVAQALESARLFEQTQGALAEVQRSRQFLSILLDSIPNPIFVKDEQGTYVECNQAFQEYIGVSREDIIGKNVYDLETSRELADHYHQMDMELFRNPGVQVYESQAQYADGPVRDVIFNKATFTRADGSIGGLIGTIVDISERKQVEAERERLLTQTEMLYNASQALLKATGPQEMLEAIAQPALETGAHAATLIYVSEDEAGQPTWAEVEAAIGPKATPIGSRFYMPESSQTRLLLAAPERPLLIDDVEGGSAAVDAQLRQSMVAMDTRAFAVVPLRVGRRWQGVATLAWPEPREFATEERQFYDLVGSQLAVSVQGHRLREEAEHRAIWLQTTAEVSRVAGTILDVDSMLREVVNLVRDRFDLYYAGLFLVAHNGHGNGDGAGQQWAILRVGTGEAGRRMVEEGHRLAVGGGSMIGRCLADKAPRIAMDVGEEAVRFDNPLLPETRTELALPLISRGSSLGALTIQSDRSAAFSDEDIAILQTMADQLAVTIENATLIESVRARAERERLTRTITDRVRRGMDRETVMRIALQELGQMLGASQSVMRLGTQAQLLGEEKKDSESSEQA